MKFFGLAISIKENQQEISNLLTNIIAEIKPIEESGGAVTHIYISEANKYDQQTNAHVYYHSEKDLNNYEEAGNKKFEEGGRSAVEAFINANRLLQNWVEDTKPNDIYDIKYDFHIGKNGEDIVEINVFYQ